jgi:hypothetical protein
MDPQIQSLLTSVGLAAATSVAAWAASKGFISTGDQSTFATDLLGVVGGIVAAGLAYWKTRTVTQTAMIQAVNKADNGVKVVASTAAAPQVSAPLK